MSVLMARLLRSQLIAQLDELEPSLAKRRFALARWVAPCMRQVIPVFSTYVCRRQCARKRAFFSCTPVCVQDL